jgi:Flp pilus assembly protein TadD
VYPSATDPDTKTARAWVVALEERAGFMNFGALAEAKVLRAEFAATLTRLGDVYWDKQHGRPFAVEYYAQALMFESDNQRAQQRVALTSAQLADVGARAIRGEFSNAELATGAMLAALADDDETQRRDRVVDLLAHERTTRASQTVDSLVNLVGAKKVGAEGAEAALAAGNHLDHKSAGAKSSADPVRAQTLATQGRKLLKKGNRSRAEQLFHKAIALDPRNFDAISGFAHLHFDRGNYGKSLSFVKTATSLRPGDADIQLLLGDVYLKTLRYPDARGAYQKARGLGHPLAAKRLTHLASLTR